MNKSDKESGGNHHHQFSAHSLSGNWDRKSNKQSVTAANSSTVNHPRALFNSVLYFTLLCTGTRCYVALCVITPDRRPPLQHLGSAVEQLLMPQNSTKQRSSNTKYFIWIYGFLNKRNNRDITPRKRSQCLTRASLLLFERKKNQNDMQSQLVKKSSLFVLVIVDNKLFSKEKILFLD